MRKRISSIVIALILFACTKEEVTPRVFPRVNTIEATDINGGGATFKAEITYSSVPIIDHGFLWSESTSPGFENADMISLGSMSEAGPFEALCDRNLEEGKKYYFRGYARSEDYTVLGLPVEFMSLGSKAPVFKDFYPSIATWEDTLTLVGENFSNVAYKNIVKFNNAIALVYKASSDTLHVRVPFDLASETSNLSVTVAGNIANLNKEFTLKPPVIESVSPSVGTSGTVVTISGQNFSGTRTRVYLNGIEVIIVNGGQKSVQIKVPANFTAGQYGLKVVTGSGNLFATSSFAFEVKSPLVTQIVPAIAGEGDEIKLVGNFFSPQSNLNTVMFDNVQATIVSSSQNEVRVIVPQYVLNTINPVISITVSGMEATSDLFSFHPPVIESFTPKAGNNTTVTITGKYFRAGNVNNVFWGDLQIPVQSSTSTKIEAFIPMISTVHSQKLKVTYQDQEALSAENFKMPWIELADYPDSDNAPGASLVYNNTGYVGFSDNLFSPFWKFNPSTKLWNRLADFPGIKRQGIVSFTAGTKAYFGGGSNSSVPVDDLWEYNFATNTWTQKSDLPMTQPLVAAFNVGNVGYIMEPDPVAQNTKLWQYNQATDKWTLDSTAPFMATPNAQKFFIGNTLYLTVNYNLWKYTTSNAQWTDLGPTPDIMYNGFSVGSFGYASTYQNLYKYDPDLNSWTLASYSPIDYYGVPAIPFSAGGLGFGFRGLKFYEFDPSF